MKCSGHGLKRKYCEQCLLELNAQQSVVIGQLYDRLNLLTGSEVLRSEQLWPVTGIEVLRTFPKKVDLSDMLDSLEDLRQVWVGSNPNGLFLFKKVNARSDKDHERIA